MSAAIELRGLRGRNPRGLFAALGALDVASRTLPKGARPTLRWSESVEPRAILTGPRDLEHLIDLCEDDCGRWKDSPVLTWGPDAEPLDDLKPRADPDLREWICAAIAGRDRADVDLLTGLVSEGAVAGNGDAKPTHFHFTAGNQKLLRMVRQLRTAIGADDLREALVGPWRYESELPGLGWDSRGEKIHAYRAVAPTKEKGKSGVPGADWLGFLGLRFFPVFTIGASAVTTGCEPSWKRGKFIWPLWNIPLGVDVVRTLLGYRHLAKLNDRDRRALGVHQLLCSPIRRTEQGGYGSFGAPDLIVQER